MQTQWEDAATEGGLDGGGGECRGLSVNLLTTRRCAHTLIDGGQRPHDCEARSRAEGGGCWGCGPPERKIGNNVSARVKSKYLQGLSFVLGAVSFRCGSASLWQS